ncbi:unnamed protein product [Rotaria magnacalcarata]|uniref:Uncharacterized protein n=1 Tax=Rotaria magnacalcarata TaxID=392030 RepID=A0A815P1C4_9BILA|nr:unnamed protein product [Rotaria magnacalcarata]
MVNAFDTIDSNIELIYKFRFDNSDKHVQLTQQQLDLIPYLSTLVANEDEHSSIENFIREYILKPPIYYSPFMAILHTITSDQPYNLFNKLDEDENILDILQLFNYLDVNSFPCPLIERKYLFQLYPTTTIIEQEGIEYYEVKNVLEARNTAAEFVIALSQKKYNLKDIKTIERIFSFLIIIFSHTDFFSSRFRHHALIIVNEYCLSLFSTKQQVQLPTIQQIAKNKIVDSWVYLFNNEQLLPENFKNDFPWKGVYKSIQKNKTNDILAWDLPEIDLPNFEFDSLESWNEPFQIEDIDIFRCIHVHSSLYFKLDSIEQSLNMFLESDVEWPLINKNRNYKHIYMSEAESARSGRFNSLPKRPKVDKFKNRFGPRDKKYR